MIKRKKKKKCTCGGRYKSISGHAVGCPIDQAYYKRKNEEKKACEFTVTRHCGNLSCDRKKLDDEMTRHVLVSVSLVEDREDFNCVWVQCLVCGHHAAIARSFEVTVGKVFGSD